jgi:hypothetical protein
MTPWFAEQVYENVTTASQFPENTTLLKLIDTRGGGLCREHKKMFEFYCISCRVD